MLPLKSRSVLARAFVMLIAQLALVLFPPTAGLVVSDSSEAQSRLCPSGVVAVDAPLIRIGVAASRTGQFAVEGGDMLNGYYLWLNWANGEYGGICVDGVPHRAELIIYDDESNAERVAAMVEHLIVIDEVRFILGPYSSDLTEVASVVTERENILMVQGNGASEVLFSRGFQNLYGVLTPASMYTRSGIELAWEMGARTAVILYEDTTFATSVAEGARQWLDEQGFAILASESYPAGVTDLTATFEELGAYNPDLFVGGGHFNDAKRYVLAASATGFCPDAYLITVGPSSPAFVHDMGALSHYIWGATQWQPSMPLSDPWFGTAADYAARYQTTYGVSPSYQAAESSAAALVLHLAIEAAGSLETSAVRAALRATDLSTFYGHIRFDETGKNIAKEMATVQIQPDGSIQVIAPRNVAETEPIWPATACARATGLASG